MRRILFLCSRNQLRSPTAEQIFGGVDNIEVASAGLNHDAEVTCTPELVAWADIIFVMEKMHKQKLMQRYKLHLKSARIICLDIPDHYQFMDPELVKILDRKVGPWLGTRRH